MSDSLVSELQTQNRRLKQLICVITVAGASVLAIAAKSTVDHQRFTEIDVERINIIMPDGKKEMVISNRIRFPAPIMNGKEFKRSGHARLGMIFYNDQGDENGGFIFDGKLDKSGNPDAGLHFSMDRFGGDQQLALGHYESNGRTEAGLKIFDTGLIKDTLPVMEAFEKAPEGAEKQALLKRLEELGARTRMFAGKNREKSAVLMLADANGKPRIRMMVTPEGFPSLDFLDENGKIIQSLAKTLATPTKQ